MMIPIWAIVVYGVVATTWSMWWTRRYTRRAVDRATDSALDKQCARLSAGHGPAPCHAPSCYLRRGRT